MSVSAAYRTQLAKQLNAALDAAEKHAATEGFAPYPFVYGYLVGDLSEDEIAAFDARLARISRVPSADSGSQE